MSPPLLLIDVGNTRVKAGRIDGRGGLERTSALTLVGPSDWEEWVDGLIRGSVGPAAVATVNPEAADRLARMLVDRGVGPIRWFRSAADVPIAHHLTYPERTGADRALAVLAAVERAGGQGPGIVIQCGTAITVERVGRDGRWTGGAIAIGPALAARSLHAGTAQLPQIAPAIPEVPPEPWGASTEPALTAGIVWGAVGAVRELIVRQAAGLVPEPWVVWTGGDAPALAGLIGDVRARVEPDLVLLGLLAAVGREDRHDGPPRGTGGESAGPLASAPDSPPVRGIDSAGPSG